MTGCTPKWCAPLFVIPLVFGRKIKFPKSVKCRHRKCHFTPLFRLAYHFNTSNESTTCRCLFLTHTHTHSLSLSLSLSLSQINHIY
ncbi:hypothetical protein BDB00DRAFT_825413 [Zychaea mexicana]|uniref:uncharacterized protein n=1 Tax=Zychaea mexicana TaxID=64656 RepID=UPI0022FDF9A5|nr:uncharacterized protein BDB00DRAFT_825413 [Zychaea mexicana]KAI9492965.1 hypothetical protein BDB00DRAFT_825413 [Zychaea mexicana]